MVKVKGFIIYDGFEPGCCTRYEKNPFRGLIETQKKMLDLTCVTMKFRNCHHASLGEADNKDK